MSDIYAAPQAPLRSASARGEAGSLERGIAGDWDFSIGAILREAWQKTAGAKLTINLALFVFAAIAGIVMALTVILPQDIEAPDWREQIAQQLISALLIPPVTLGLYVIGIRRAVDAPISAGMIIGQYRRIVPLFVLQILSTILILLGFVLLILPGIYLAVGYGLSMPLVADKGLGPWQALEASRRAVGKHWFKVLGLGLAIAGINLLAVLTLGIGFFWTAPMSVIAYGILYRTIFGVEPATAGEAAASALG
ncbi:MAG: hypothetical protein R3F21_21540 [Myxococcota bacterium]